MATTDTSNTPDLTPLLRQRDLDDRVAELLQKAFDTDNTVITDFGDDGHFLIVDDTSGGFIKATLYRGGWASSTEVAQVRLDITVTPTTQPKPERPAPTGGSECRACGKDNCFCGWTA